MIEYFWVEEYGYSSYSFKDLILSNTSWNFSWAIFTDEKKSSHLRACKSESLTLQKPERNETLKGSGAKTNKPRNPSHVSHNKMIAVVAVGSGCLIQREKEIRPHFMYQHQQPSPAFHQIQEPGAKKRAPLKPVKSETVFESNIAFLVCCIAWCFESIHFKSA